MSQGCAKSRACVMEQNRDIHFQCWWSWGEGVKMSDPACRVEFGPWTTGATGMYCTLSLCDTQWTFPPDHSGVWEMTLKCNFGDSLLMQMGWLWRDRWACNGLADWLTGWWVGGGGVGGESTHHLYNLPVVPDGTTQNHAEDHSYDLKSDTFWDMLKHLWSFM